MNEQATQHGVCFVVATIASAAQVHPDRATGDMFGQSMRDIDIFYPDKLVSRFLARGKVMVVTLGPTMRKMAEEKEIYFHGAGDRIGQGHWNDLGHQVAGQILAQSLPTYCKALQ